MEITAIEAQKKTRDRVSVFLDEKFWIGMSIELFEELELKKGLVLSKQRKEEIEKLVEEDRAFHSALRSLSYKDYSQAEIERKLKEKGYPEKAIKKALERCLALGLLDDLAYAETVALNKKSSGQGRRRVQEYLRQAGIKQEEIANLLEENFPAEEETDEAHLVLKRKYPSKLNPEEERRAQDFLLRRGFSFAAVSQAIGREKMSEEERESFYGAEEALLRLKRRWPRVEEMDRDKAWRFLIQKGFSRSSAEEAIRTYSSSR